MPGGIRERTARSTGVPTPSPPSIPPEERRAAGLVRMLAVRSMSVPYARRRRGPSAEGHEFAWTSVNEFRDLWSDSGPSRAGGPGERVRTCRPTTGAGGTRPAPDPVRDAELVRGLRVAQVRPGDAQELGVGDGAGGTRRKACEVGTVRGSPGRGRHGRRWAGHRAAGPPPYPAPRIAGSPGRTMRCGTFTTPAAPTRLSCEGDGHSRAPPAAGRHPQCPRRRRLSGGGWPARALADAPPLGRAHPAPGAAAGRRFARPRPAPGHRPPLARGAGAGAQRVPRARPAVRYTSIPLLADDPTPHGGLAGMYRHVFDARAAQLAEVVRALLEPTTGCPPSSAAPRARTGPASRSPCCSTSLACRRDVIVDDYALSAGYFARRRVARSSRTTGGSRSRRGVDSPPEFMAGRLDHLDQQHGGARSLLRAAGSPDAELDRLVDPAHRARRRWARSGASPRQLPYPAETVYRVATRIQDLPRWLPEVVGAELLDPTLSRGQPRPVADGTGGRRRRDHRDREAAAAAVDAGDRRLRGPLSIDVRTRLDRAAHVHAGRRSRSRSDAPPLMGFIAREAERRINAELFGRAWAVQGARRGRARLTALAARALATRLQAAGSGRSRARTREAAGWPPRRSPARRTCHAQADIRGEPGSPGPQRLPRGAGPDERRVRHAPPRHPTPVVQGRVVLHAGVRDAHRRRGRRDGLPGLPRDPRGNGREAAGQRARDAQRRRHGRGGAPAAAPLDRAGSGCSCGC